MKTLPGLSYLIQRIFFFPFAPFALCQAQLPQILFVSPVANSNAAEFLKLHFMFPLGILKYIASKVGKYPNILISNSILIPILGRAWAQGKEKQGEKVWML